MNFIIVSFNSTIQKLLLPVNILKTGLKSFTKIDAMLRLLTQITDSRKTVSMNEGLLQIYFFPGFYLDFKIKNTRILLWLSESNLVTVERTFYLHQVGPTRIYFAHQKHISKSTQKTIFKKLFRNVDHFKVSFFL